jgi:ribosomal protein S18 acetylase RimI-like enzyme
MLVVKRMHEVPLEQAVLVFHQNEYGNFYDIERDIRHFAARFGREGLSPVLSVVTFKQEEPVGVVLSGVREMGGEKVAWISDNVVVPKFREAHVRETMMERVLSAFEEEGVTLATVEVNADNEQTIQFYHDMGFEIVDRLLLMKGVFEESPEDGLEQGVFTVEKTVAQDARFFNDIRIVPWKNQWQNLRSDGELLIIKDDNNQRVGHIIFKKNYDKSHALSHMMVHQWRIEEDHPDAETIFEAGWMSLNAFTNGQTPFVASLLASDWQMVERLEGIGFDKISEKVFMIKRF